MTDQIRDAEINKLSLRNGLIIGIVSVVLSIVYRIIDPLLQFTNIWVQVFTFAIIIALLVVMAQDVRRKTGGFWTFGEAFRCLIIMSLIITVFTVAYNFVLFKYIDPSLPSKVKDVTLENLNNRLNSAGLDQSKIDEITKPLENGELEAKLAPTFKNELTTFGIGLLIYAIIDLIIAAIIKKNPPVFVVDDNAEV